MTTKDAEGIKYHLNKALDIFSKSNRFFCSEYCKKCDFQMNGSCFLLNDLNYFVQKLNRIKKSVIPNDRKRRKKE